MVLGSVDRARRLSGNPTISNVSDDDISTGLAYGTSQVARLTGKANFETDTTHPDYATAVMASEYYASSMVRDRFNDQTDISSEHYTRANDLLNQIAINLGNIPGAGGTGVDIAVGRYRSNPLNSSATTYRSMYSPGQQLVGVRGGTGDYESPPS